MGVQPLLLLHYGVVQHYEMRLAVLDNVMAGDAEYSSA
jgi:hypothetical protein